jgi:hypothetical protein
MLRDNWAGLIEPMLSSAAARNLGFSTSPAVHDSRAVRTAQKQSHRTIDPRCLENPRPEGAESTLPGNAASPFPAEPRHYKVVCSGTALTKTAAHCVSRHMIPGLLTPTPDMFE